MRNCASITRISVLTFHFGPLAAVASGGVSRSNFLIVRRSFPDISAKAFMAKAFFENSRRIVIILILCGGTDVSALALPGACGRAFPVRPAPYLQYLLCTLANWHLSNQATLLCAPMHVAFHFLSC